MGADSNGNVCVTVCLCTGTEAGQMGRRDRHTAGGAAVALEPSSATFCCARLHMAEKKKRFFSKWDKRVVVGGSSFAPESNLI